MSDLKELRHLAKAFTILYVEDNEALRDKATIVLKKFFSRVDVAEDGQAGLEKFKELHYPIVVTDIKMPKMDGMTLLEHIRKINPDTKVIIMSAFDDKEYLFKGIELGAFRFLTKPVNVAELSDVLYEAILQIKEEQNTKLFYRHLKNVFDYQSSMVVMLHGGEIVLANDMFLEFFNYESMEECKIGMRDIGEKFLEHDGFLYNHEGVNAMQTLRNNAQKLYHTKLKNKKGEIRHLIVKYQEIPEKKEYGVLSFDDVTELNLLKLFDEKQTEMDENIVNTQAMFDLLDVIQRNSAKVEIHNYYKGLSITNDAVIVDIMDESVTIKTSYIQQKAIQVEQKSLMISDALPFAIEASQIEKISFEKQSVTLKSLHFVKTSPVMRSTIRVVPGEKQTVSLFLGENKFHGDVEIEDISLEAVKLKLNALPAGLEKGSEVTLDIVLELDKKPLIINTKATMYRKSESRYSFYVVFMFKGLEKNQLVKYITKRQMELIREIKGMQNG